VSSTKVAAEVSYQTLVAGVPTVFAGQTQFVLPSGTYTLAELLAPFQKRIAMAEATKTADAQYHAAVEAEQAVVAVADPLRNEVKQLAVARFGKESSVLAQLGFPPAKPREISAATKAASAAKAKATRAAKKAASAAAGVTPAAAPAAPAPAPATPAPSPKPGS
jgi:translation initiation factor IF-2